jgi:hypothetical protein
MFTIELTEQQLRSLKMFLERSEMRGYETAQFLALVQVINSATPSEEKEKKSIFRVEEK